jgi:hypothetical protein
VSDGRQLLNEILESPLKFTPLPKQGKVYHCTGPLVTGKVIAEIIEYPLEGSSPTGTAEGWPLPVKGFSDLKEEAA